MNYTAIDGIMLSIAGDMGPDPILNLSSLDDLTSLKLSIVGMTVISMGLGSKNVRKKRHYKMHGPIPVPDSNYEALCVPFNVHPDLGTKDNRIEAHGRECTLWYLFSSNKRRTILSRINQIETITRDVLLPFKNESELRNESVFIELLNKIQELEFNGFTQTKQIIDNTINYTIENSSFGFFTIDKEGNSIPIYDFRDISDLDVLIMADLSKKQLNVMKLKNKITKTRMYLAGKAASKLNIEKLKREFTVRKIYDELEMEMLLQKIEQIKNDFS